MKEEELFKDKDKEKGVGVTNLISRIVQVLKRELVQLKVSIQELKELEPVKPWNKG